ncbi:MAG: HTH-type transcriptional repressor YtrA [Candidatus Marinimicrobia bacterium]|nr:HTH-type transcriptional repressor YtrA [Candidatus Neomarinimicrobiota bacterium]
MTIQFESDTPIYLQIAEMIRQSILAGEIGEGEAIPSVRQISVEQNLNPQTVLNATQQLINEDLIEKRRGLGMFVKEGAQKKLMQRESEKFRQEEIPGVVDRAKLLDISEDELVEIVKESYEEEEE